MILQTEVETFVYLVESIFVKKMQIWSGVKKADNKFASYYVHYFL